MFQWQVDCLSTGNVLDGGNLGMNLESNFLKNSFQ